MLNNITEQQFGVDRVYMSVLNIITVSSLDLHDLDAYNWYPSTFRHYSRMIMQFAIV